MSLLTNPAHCPLLQQPPVPSVTAVCIPANEPTLIRDAHECAWLQMRELLEFGGATQPSPLLDVPCRASYRRNAQSLPEVTIDQDGQICVCYAGSTIEAVLGNATRFNLKLLGPSDGQPAADSVSLDLRCDWENVFFHECTHALCLAWHLTQLKDIGFIQESLTSTDFIVRRGAVGAVREVHQGWFKQHGGGDLLEWSEGLAEVAANAQMLSIGGAARYEYVACCLAKQIAYYKISGAGPAEDLIGLCIEVFPALAPLQSRMESIFGNVLGGEAEILAGFRSYLTAAAPSICGNVKVMRQLAAGATLPEIARHPFKSYVLSSLDDDGG